MTEGSAPSSTMTALIDAAEQRFATDGIDGASLRAVMRDAAADPGAIHYHFGDRQSLAVAVLDRVLAPLNARRLALLAELEGADGSARPAGQELAPVPLGSLVEAIIRPDIEAAVALNGRGRGRARLIAAVYLHPADFVRTEVEGHFAPVAQRFMPHLVVAVPTVPAETLAWRVRWFVFGVIGALMADDDAPFATGSDALIADLVTTAGAALAAPAPMEGT